MNTKPLKVLVNNTLVGFMSDLEVDMPSFRARFEPTPAFHQFESLFVSLDQAFDEKHYDRTSQLNEEINKLKISIIDDDGQLHYSSDSSAPPHGRISYVRIRSDEICWRPL